MTKQYKLSIAVIVLAVLAAFVDRIFPVCLCVLYIGYMTSIIDDMNKQQNATNKILNIYESFIIKHLRRYENGKKKSCYTETQN